VRTSAGDASARPSQRALITWAAALFALALGLRLHSAVTAPLFTSDGAYYYAVAERLHGGHGLTIPYVWNYLGGIPDSLPIPSNRYWMPMTSLLQAGAFAVAGGASPLAGQMPSVVLGALLAAFTFVVGQKCTSSDAGSMYTVPILFAGAPDTMVCGGTVFLTKLPALTMECGPISTPLAITLFAPM